MAGRIRELPDDELLDDGSNVAGTGRSQSWEDEEPRKDSNEDPSMPHGVTSIRAVSGA
jgi:hypothetical protein